MKRASIAVFICVWFLAGGLQAESDSKIITLAKATLKYMGIDVIDVKIADGRAKGGERVIIITYMYTLEDEGARLSELVKILEMGQTLNKMNAKIDVVRAIAGDRYGKASAIITINASDATWFIRTKDATGYLKRWNVYLLQSNFLPNTALNMGW
ncbi:MAG: hypothetical protein V3W43_08100 [Desulfatiglandaceae bacterium]